MSDPKENPLLHRAISLAQSGRVEDAHALLHKITGEDPSQEMAWLWLVQTEPDPAQRIQILEECLRHNPESEYAKKGLAGLRTGPLSGPKPAAKTPSRARPKKTPRSQKPTSFGCKRLMLLGVLAALIALVIAGILFYPQWKGWIPSIPFPMINAPMEQASLTSTATDTAERITSTATKMFTQTITQTKTRTRKFTPSLTNTPTVTSTATLFQGVSAADEPVLLYIASGRCEVFRLPISGGPPESLTKTIPADCSQAELSPDGQKMTFISLPEANTIQMTNLDGSWRRKVAGLASNTGVGRTIWSLEWAPDGSSIAFIASGFAKDSQGVNRVNELSGYLYTVTMSSGYSKQLKALGIEKIYSGALSWSPDSQWVYALDRGNPLETLSFPYAFRTSDSRTIWIAREDTVRGYYDWSPDSMYLSSLLPWKPPTNALPVEAPEDQAYIILAGLDESKYYIPLAEEGYDPLFGARWFPDRSAFLLYNKETKRLVSVSKEGVLDKIIADLAQAPAFVSWSPDGQWLAIVEGGSVEENGGTLLIVHPDGTDLRILARGIGAGPVIWK